jgi:Asp-tRNA(Asn)/Glu-tRNA(Gln) amidotransferase A subunit family amidase
VTEKEKPMVASIGDARVAIESGTLTALALAESQLARIAATDGAIGAWETLDASNVREQASRADGKGCPGLLGGIGIGVKDIIATGDHPTSAGTPIYAGHQPSEDATCVKRLRAAGAFVFGKTVTTPLAYMDPSRTRNPWNSAYSPGGSSSGSAAAVAAGHVLATIGTQTNGSIIRPAAYCGVVGYKPTVGAISVAGVHPFAPTFDTVGTFARNVADAARVASALTDRGRIAANVAAPAHRPRFAWLPKFPWVEPDYETLRALAHALDALRDAAEIVPLSVPSAWKEAKAIHRTLMLKEGSEVLGALQARERERLTPAINAAIDDGHAISSEAHREAIVARERAIAFFTGWLDEYDAVLSPSAPGTAPRGLDTTGDPSCCSLWSLLGFPAINIPAGLVDGLPVGLQLAAPQGRDDSLLSAAAWCEERIAFPGLPAR